MEPHHWKFSRCDCTGCQRISFTLSHSHERLNQMILGGLFQPGLFCASDTGSISRLQLPSRSLSLLTPVQAPSWALFLLLGDTASIHPSQNSSPASYQRESWLSPHQTAHAPVRRSIVSACRPLSCFFSSAEEFGPLLLLSPPPEKAENEGETSLPLCCP